MKPVSALAAAALALCAFDAASALAAPDEPPAMLLVASPKIDDPRFRESVVLVLRHGRGGPLGVIVNKGSDVTLATVFKKPEEAKLAAKPLHFGGPIEPQRLIALYRDPQPQPRDSLQIADGLWMSQSQARIERVLERPPESFKIMAGFSGWARGQLEHEIARGDWYLLPLDQSVLFGADDATLWSTLLQRASQRSAALPSRPPTRTAEPHPLPA